MISSGAGRPGRACRAGPQLLDRTFAILALFTESAPVWSASEVARALALPTPTAHRILRALRSHRYLRQDPETKRFALGLAAATLGDRAHATSDIRRLTDPTMR